MATVAYSEEIRATPAVAAEKANQDVKKTFFILS